MRPRLPQRLLENAEKREGVRNHPVTPHHLEGGVGNFR